MPSKALSSSPPQAPSATRDEIASARRSGVMPASYSALQGLSGPGRTGTLAPERGGRMRDRTTAEGRWLVGLACLLGACGGAEREVPSTSGRFVGRWFLE